MAAAVARRPAGVLPPASPFAQLLRRSRFASYDPEVKQAYSAPPEYAHRGNWGLKRPIAQKRRNAYITLKSFEDHAQFIEWNNAEAQVRFVKRFEELNVTPRVNPDTTWGKAIGANASSIWLTDSEFDSAKDTEYRYLVDEDGPQQEEQEELSLSDLGKRGPGQYADAHPKSTISLRQGVWNYRQPNIDAMSPDEFSAYIDKLRTLRPAFFERIRTELARTHSAASSLNPSTSDLKIAMNKAISADHRAFINDYFERQYASRSDDLAAPDPESGEALPRDFVNPKIKPQPHRSGGLMYAHPTLLDTFFSTKPKPALILNEENPDSKFTSKSITGPVPITVSFGGVLAQLEKPQRGLKTLFAPHSGPEEGVDPKNIVNVRVSQFELDRPPAVVGKDGQGLSGVKVKGTVMEIYDEKHRSAVPGSLQYSRDFNLDTKSMMSNWGAISGKPTYARSSSHRKGRDGARLSKKQATSMLKEMAQRGSTSPSSS